MRPEEFAKQMAAYVDGALGVSARSPDVKDVDPFLANLVGLIQSEPAHRTYAITTLCALVPRMELAHGVIEMLEYCVHVLRPPELLQAVEAHLRTANDELERGESLRPWQTRNHCEHILTAAEIEWPDADMYPSLRRE